MVNIMITIEILCQMLQFDWSICRIVVITHDVYVWSGIMYNEPYNQVVLHIYYVYTANFPVIRADVYHGRSTSLLANKKSHVIHLVG